ncbi:hypothetical protein BGZ99_004976 [Dissophora globulifera]|uniref:Uncharacterized protein n=1 Tax=Dissophora globulifera TaxID=979702 RepID=A0A9P6RL25_9FUNG|nr:hypothetical protein BGZ99_004976 [Dissophora globulifera]
MNNGLASRLPAVYVETTSPDYQHFHDGNYELEVRVFPGTPLTQGRPFVIWDDIQDVFPGIVRLQSGIRVIGFMADAEGQRLHPLRIEHQPTLSLQVIYSPDDSSRTISSNHTASSTLSRSISPSPNSRRRMDGYDSQSSTPPISPVQQQKAFVFPPLARSGTQSSHVGSEIASSTPKIISRPPRFARDHSKIDVNDEMLRRPLDSAPQGRDSSTTPTVQRTLSHRAMLSNNGDTGLEALIQQREDASTWRNTVLSQESLSDVARQELHSSFKLYDEFLQLAQGGQTAQKNRIRDAFLGHLAALQGEMLQNPDLQHHMEDMQRAMMQTQLQTLDRMAVIQRQVQSIMAQMYELHEYTVPRLFIVLPDRHVEWNPARLLQNKMRLHFLCDGGEHTADFSTKVPRHCHVVTHEGYAIEDPSEFFRRYGTHALSLLQMLKHGATVGGSVVLPLAQYYRSGDELELEVERAIDYLEYYCRSNAMLLSWEDSSETDLQEERPQLLKAADFRQLPKQLKMKEGRQALGNLYRNITDTGRVNWMCPEHYRQGHGGITMINHLSGVVALNKGAFNEFTGRVQVSLPSSAAAQDFYEALKKGRFVHELKVTLLWKLSKNDLKTLRDTFLYTNVAILDLTCPTPDNASSGLLSRNLKSDALWDIMMSPRILSFRLSGYSGFFSRAKASIQRSNLRVLKIAERIDWKKDGANVTDLLTKCPHLKELRLTCTDIDTAFLHIKGANYDTRSLESLALDSGDERNELRVQFKAGIPTAMDLVTSNASSTILKEARVLQSLHFRPGLHVRVNVASHLFVGVVARNPTLVSLTVQCEATDFLRLHIAIKDAITNIEDSKLRTVQMYGSRNQLFIKDIQSNAGVELELLTTNVPRACVMTLLRVYGTRLTKFKIDGDVLNSLTRILENGDELQLKHIEINLSGLRAEMLPALRKIIQRCEPILSILYVSIDRMWEATATELREGLPWIGPHFADFIIEFQSWWTRISIFDDLAEPWIKELEQRGYRIPEKVLKMESHLVQPSTTFNIMPILALQIKAELENITELVPADADHTWHFKVQCTKCREIDANFITMNAIDKAEMGSGRGEANLVMKCKFCKCESSADLVSKPVAYDIEHNDKFATLITIECRGLELVGFEPREGWKAKGAESGTVFEDIDLTEGDWAEYDEKSELPVGITSIESKFIKVK